MGDSIREYARHAKVSHNVVWKWKNDGHLVLGKDGKIDRAASDKRRASTIDPSRAGGRGNGNGALPGNAEFHIARAAEKAVDARLKEIKLRERIGELVEAGAIRQEIHTLTQRAIAMLDALPARVVPLLGVNDPDEAIVVLEREIDRVKAQIADAASGAKP